MDASLPLAGVFSVTVSGTDWFSVGVHGNFLCVSFVECILPSKPQLTGFFPVIQEYLMCWKEHARGECCF